MMTMAAIDMNSNANLFKNSFWEASNKTSLRSGIDKYLRKTAKAELNIIDNSKAYIKKWLCSTSVDMVKI